MSSSKQDQEVVFECDNCGEVYEIASHDFKEACEAAKSYGWRCFKNDDEEWEHRCPDCRSHE